MLWAKSDFKMPRKSCLFLSLGGRRRTLKNLCKRTNFCKQAEKHEKHEISKKFGPAATLFIPFNSGCWIRRGSIQRLVLTRQSADRWSQNKMPPMSDIVRGPKIALRPHFIVFQLRHIRAFPPRYAKGHLRTRKIHVPRLYNISASLVGAIYMGDRRYNMGR